MATVRASLAVAEYTPPRNDIEEQLASLWAEVLDVDAVGRDDDFFALGGDSLTAMWISVRIRDTHGLRLAPNVLFTHPTVADLGARISSELDGTDRDAPAH